MGRYEQAIQALIEAMPDTDPFAGPVRHLSAKLELSNAEAHALTMELVEKNLIRPAAAGSGNFGEALCVSRTKYVWERCRLNDV
jgi:hypothetical protein